VVVISSEPLFVTKRHLALRRALGLGCEVKQSPATIATERVREIQFTVRGVRRALPGAAGPTRAHQFPCYARVGSCE
jgi:hypothetical protein